MLRKNCSAGIHPRFYHLILVDGQTEPSCTCLLVCIGERLSCVKATLVPSDLTLGIAGGIDGRHHRSGRAESQTLCEGISSVLV
jgi:hypothetical protein